MKRSLRANMESTIMVRSALMQQPMTAREISQRTRMWYNSVGDVVRFLKDEGEISSLGKVETNHSRAELLSLEG